MSRTRHLSLHQQPIDTHLVAVYILGTGAQSTRNASGEQCEAFSFDPCHSYSTIDEWWQAWPDWFLVHPYSELAVVDLLTGEIVCYSRSVPLFHVPRGTK